MTANRRAELQRKLGMVPVPKPPAGLAERIKSDIPKELMVDADKERRRLRQAVSFNVRVAASIILLVSSVYLALNLVSRRFGPMEMASKSAAPIADTATSTMAYQPPTQLAKAQDTANTATMSVPVSAKPAPQAKLQARKQVIVAEVQPEQLALRDDDAPAAAAELKEERREREAASLGVSASAPAAPMALPAPPPPPPPPAAKVSVDALVERYARAESVPLIPRLEVEIAGAPFDDAKHIVRVSIDGRHDEAPRVVFDDEAVAAWRAVAADGTALYEVVLRPGTHDVIAVAYAGDLKRTIRGTDVRAWKDASRRTKSASLAAALASGASPADVAAKARAAGLDELAAEADRRKQ
jgi:hypothetical protein